MRKKMEFYSTLREEFEERVSPPHLKGSTFFNIKSCILSHILYTFFYISLQIMMTRIIPGCVYNVHGLGWWGMHPLYPLDPFL